MGFQDVEDVPELHFVPHSQKIVMDVNASGRPHVLRLWLVASNAMLLKKTFAPTNPLFCVGLISC